MNFEVMLYRISQSNEVAFRQLFEHFFPGLLSFSTAILKNQHIAEEVVEDVFIKLWEKRDTVTLVRNVSFYLYKAVRYASINALEKQKKNASISLDETGDSFSFSYSKSDLSLISKENCQKISDAISQLPPKCKLIFRLVKDEGMKYKEVAELLNLSEKTVENQMNIAFKKLIESLNATVPELSLHFLTKAKTAFSKDEEQPEAKVYPLKINYSNNMGRL